MADNVLKAVISVAAPGAQQAFAAVSKGAESTAVSLEGIGPPAARFQESIKKIIPAAGQTRSAITSLIPPISALGDSIETLRAKALLKQQAIVEEKDIAKVVILNKELDLLLLEIKRIGNAGKTGFDALGNAIIKPVNNITRLADSIKKGTSQFTILGKAGQLAGSNLGSLNGVLLSTQTLVPALTTNVSSANAKLAGMASSAGKAFGVMRQLAFILPGLGIAGIFSLAFTAIESVVGSLFSLKRGFSDAELAAAQFKEALDGIAGSAQKLKDKLDFQSDIAKLRAQLSGLKGEDLNIFDLGNRTSDAVKIITAEERITQALLKTKKAAEDQARVVLASGVASEKFKDIALKFGSANKIPKTLLEGLPEREKEFLSSYIEVLDKLEDSKERSAKAQESIGKNFLTSQNEQRDKELDAAKKQEDELKKLRDKSVAEYDKFVSSTISRGKALADFFKGRAVVPTFTLFDSQQEQLRKSLGIISQFEAGKLEIIFREVEMPTVEQQIIDGVRNKIKDAKESLKSILTEKLPTNIDLSSPSKSFQDLQKSVKDATDEQGKSITDTQKKSEQLASTISGIVAPAFQDLFSTIVAGKSPLDAFFKGIVRAVDQLIAKLIAAAIQALVLSAITGGGTTFGSAFTKLLGFADGGPVGSNKPIIVGERGPEIFVPNTGGNIIPNHQMGGGVTYSQSGSGKVVFEIAGNKLVGVLSNTTRSQGRLS